MMQGESDRSGTVHDNLHICEYTTTMNGSPHPRWSGNSSLKIQLVFFMYRKIITPKYRAPRIKLPVVEDCYAVKGTTQGGMKFHASVQTSEQNRPNKTVLYLK
jgi:hypothetical protein